MNKEDLIKEFDPIEGWYPLEVQIEITYDCTLRCAMCYNGVRANEKKFNDYLKECNFGKMDVEKEKRLNNVIDICIENGAKFFTITGGEPLLYPEVVIKLIKKIKENGGYASINSNATVIDSDLAFKLKEAGLNSALISIHGADEATHAKTVCVSDALKLTLNGIKYLMMNDIKVVPNFVASHVNVSKLKETAEMLYGLGIKTQAYSIFIPTPGVLEHDKLKMTKEDNQLYFEQLHELNSKYSDLKATATLPVPPCLSKGIVEPEVLDKFEFRTCPSGRQFMVVNELGNASPCIQYAWNEKYGSNIYLEKGKLSKQLSQWKKIMNTPEKCFNCGSKSYCNPCNMNILRENNDTLAPLNEPYPGYKSLSLEEGEKFKEKLEIRVENSNWNKVFKLKENIIIREEKEGYLTIINPSIQGYTIVKGVSKEELMSNFKFMSLQHYNLFKAMNMIEEVHSVDYNILNNLTTAPKYKILTELIGYNFTNNEAVYCLRTDTAGRFFCLANTEKEQEIYDEVKKHYKKELKKIKNKIL